MLTKDKDYFKEKLYESIKGKNVIIASHISPDDDSIGSCISAYFHLKDICNPRIMITGKKNDRWKEFEGFDYVEFVEDIANFKEDADVYLVLDGNSWSRFSYLAKPKKVFCIDHHFAQETDLDLHLYLDYPCCVQIIYELFYEEKSVIPKHICEIMLVGILGDTGNFSYVKKGSSEVLLVAQKLIEQGDIQVQELQSKYSKMGKNVFEELKKIIDNAKIVQLEGWPTFIYTYTESLESDAQEAASAFLFYLRTIEGVDWGFIAKQDEDGTKFSLRTLPSAVNVRLIAENFNGGGHDNAAGMKIPRLKAGEAVDKLIDFLKSASPEKFLRK